jgi:hypothetical protein
MGAIWKRTITQGNKIDALDVKEIRDQTDWLIDHLVICSAHYDAVYTNNCGSHYTTYYPSTNSACGGYCGPCA